MEPTISPAGKTSRRSVTRCLHCGAATADEDFCCSGCEAAHRIIQHGINPDNTTLFAPYAVLQNDGLQHLTLAIRGIHCASCIQLIENALNAETDVQSARVNMSTGRLHVTWQGKAERADALATIVAKLGYGVAPYDMEEAPSSQSQESLLLRCMAVAGFAAGNLMMISVGLWASTGETMGIATRDFLHYISVLIALPTIFYAGQPFFTSAFSVLKQGHTNMDVPISLAVILASLMSLSEALRHGEHLYFDSAVMLLFFLLIGRYLDARAKGKARETAQDLLSMLSGTATILQDGTPTAIPIREVKEGMVALVAAGQNVPADGFVLEGTSEMDISLITGETLPEPVQKDSPVFAGTTNLSAPLRITIARASENSLLSDIVKLMEKAEQGQATYVRLADKAARLYTPIVHTLGLLTFLGWWLVMDMAWQPALLIAITVLIITCPCALGLAVPVVQVLASSLLMKRGILLKSGDALEKLAAMDIAVFDKTGTLTLGKPTLESNHHTETELQQAASLAVHSHHPLSRAISHAYPGPMLEVSAVEEHPGEGLQGRINGQTMRLGKQGWCGDTKAPPHAGLELWMTKGKEKPIRFTFTDPLRPDAEQTIAALQAAGIRTILLSGDREEAVAPVARKLNIDEYHSGTSPTEKCAFLETLQNQGHRPLMVGDGLNDAPSLAAASVSISPASAMDISQRTADIVFQGVALSSVWYAWLTARRSTTLVKQNFGLAVLYNLIAIPLAVLGHVTPLIAAIAMSGSSLIVIGNSFRLNQMRNNRKEAW